MSFKTRPNFEVTNQSKASFVRVDSNAVYVGTVVRSDETGVYVNVPNLATNKIFGPCQVFGQKPRSGRAVIVGFSEGKRQKMVVLGSENRNFKLINLDPPVEDDDAATKKYVDDKVAELLQELIAKSPGHVLPYQAPGSYASSAHTH